LQQRKPVGLGYLENRVSLSGETMSKARTCEKGFVFTRTLQTKAHLAFALTWRLMCFLQRRKLIEESLMSFYNGESLVRMIG